MSINEFSMQNENSNSCQIEKNNVEKIFEKKCKEPNIFQLFEIKNVKNGLSIDQIEAIGKWGKDISPKKDGGLVKVVVEKGIGESRPLFGDTAYVEYQAWKGDGGRLTEGRKDCSFVVGRAEVILAWEFGIGSMTEGEVAMLSCSDYFAHGSEGLPPSIPQHSSLIFRLRLVRWHGEDISDLGDGSLYKSLLKNGESYGMPNEGALCTVEMVGRCRGRQFEGRTVTFEYGEGENEGILKGVETALSKFSRGEEARLKIRSDLCYGKMGSSLHQIPPDCDLEYDVHLKECQRMKDFWDMSDEEKVQESVKDKAKGVKYFKEGKVDKASKFFTKVVEYLQFIIDKEEGDERMKKHLLTSSLVNLAICQLKMDEPFEAEKSCSKALEIEPCLLKAVYNRAQANIKMKNFSSAAGDLKRLTETNAGSSAVRGQLEVVLEKEKKMKDSEKNRYFGMFDK